MRGLISAFLVVALISTTASALKCYYCAGSISGDCARGETSAMVYQECADFLKTSTMASSKYPEPLNRILAREEGEETCISLVINLPGFTAFQRGCAALSEEDADVCEELEEVDGITACAACEDDLCNVPKISFCDAEEEEDEE